MAVLRNLVVIGIILLLVPIPQVESQAQVPVMSAKDDNIYLGYYWGAAGIIDGLLKIRQSDLISSTLQSRIDKMVETGIEGIWNERMIDQDGEIITAWSKVANFNEVGIGEIYPSKKYGTAGIVEMLLHAYEMYGDETYLNYSIQAIDEVYLEVAHFDLPHWPYSFVLPRGSEGIYITDQSFGSMGIIDSTLDLYKITNDTKYLDLAVDATQWVYDISYLKNVSSTENNVIPWYDWDEKLNITYTSYTQGNGGAIPVLLKLSKLTSNSTWSDWAQFLGDWLIHQQSEEGAWHQNPYIPNPVYDTGFELGITGVITALEELKTSQPNSELSNAINRGYTWLLDRFVSNSTHQIFPFNSIQTGAKYNLYQGMAGITRLLRNQNITTPYLELSYDWLLDNALYEIEIDGNEILGFYSTSAQENYVDISYTYGMTGVIEELLLGAKSTNFDLPINFVERLITTLEVFQLTSGLWPRQFVVESSFWDNVPNQLFIIFGLVVVGVLILYYRSRKNQDLN